MESEDVQAALDEAQGLAQKLGIRGTPFDLNEECYRYGLPQDLYDQLVKKVSEVREQR